MLERLIYTSTAREGLPLQDIHRIVGRAQMRNRQLDVTGLLLFRRPFFIQVLEGRAELLDLMLTDLGRDARHHGLSLIDRRPVALRRFDRWHMELLVTDALADAAGQLRAGTITPDAMLDAMLDQTQFL